MAANYKYSGSPLGTAYSLGIKSPMDVRSVVNGKDTIATGEAYVGMLVFDTTDSNLYVCTEITTRPSKVTWKLISSSSVSTDDLAKSFGARIVTSFDELVSEDLLFPYKGRFAVVSGSTDKDGLWVLKTTPNTDAGNWMQVINSGAAESYVTYTEKTVNPNAITKGITLGIDENAVIEDYVSPTYLYGDVEYSSYGLVDKNGIHMDIIKVGSKNGNFESYLEFYAKGSDNWLKIHIPDGDNSLGLNIDNITVNGNPYVNDTPIPVGSLVKFGSDIDMKNMIFSVHRDDPLYDNITSYTPTFADLLNIYREMPLPVAYLSVNGAEVRVLTDADMYSAAENINVSVDWDGSESEFEEGSVTIQEFVTKINNEINDIKTTVISPDSITDEEIGSLFN